ncbi:hypothetical protein T01_6796, partial [Trichinella spiralis]
LENSVPTNHGRRERKEATRANFRQKAEQHNPHASIKLAVAGEGAQSPFDVVFSAVVALRCSCVCVYGGWVPAKTSSEDMLQVNPFVSSIGGEAQ